MTYILILMLWWGSSPIATSIEFTSQHECLLALEAVKAEWGTAGFAAVCVKK